MVIKIIPWIGCMLIALGVWGNTIPPNYRQATTLSNVRLYADSSFTKPTETYFAEGTLFEVISETAKEQLDDSQNQQFKWFKVKIGNNQTGWIYGDALAVSLPLPRVPALLKAFHHKEYHFNNGFEKATVWVAAVEGRDHLHPQDFLNPAYKEYYIVCTNDRKQCVTIPIGTLSAQGKTEIRKFDITDVTGDSIPDFLIEQSSFSGNNPFDNREVSIYTFAGGTLVRAFNERTSLNYEDDVPAPSLYKYLEIGPGTVRVAYVDYSICKEDSLKKTNKDQNRCLTYVTYSYAWNKRQRVYKALYSPTRSPVTGRVTHEIYLTNGPERKGAPSMQILPTDMLKVEQHREQFVVENGVKKLSCILLVSTPDGRSGYVPAKEVLFDGIEHADLLEKYYANPPVVKTDWKSEETFVR